MLSSNLLLTHRGAISAGCHSACFCVASSPTIHSNAGGRTFGQRQYRRGAAVQSTHWGADDSVDELLYDSKSVDDWGVNRDMSGAYRQVSYFSSQGMPDCHPYSKHGNHAFSQGRCIAMQM